VNEFEGFEGDVASGDERGEDGADEADGGVTVGEDAHHVGSRADLALGVVGPDLAPDRLGERREGEDVLLGLFPSSAGAVKRGTSFSVTARYCCRTASGVSWEKTERTREPTIP